MTHPDGGFYSSLDADSDGHEGRYYVWQPAEIEAALPDSEDRALFHQVYTVTRSGNFEGYNILQRKGSLSELSGSLASTKNLIAASKIRQLCHTRAARPP